MNRRELFKFFHLCVLEKSAIQQQNDTCASLGPPYNEFKLFQSQEFCSIADPFILLINL